MLKRIKLRFLFVIMVSFFINLTITNAATCDNKKLEELKQKADNIEIHTEINEDNLELGIYNMYDVTISGLTNEFFIATNTQTKIFDKNDEVDGIIMDTINTDTKSFDIYATECGETIIKSIDVKLLNFNEFSLYEECKDIGEKLDVCSKFYDGDLTYAKFKKEIDKYYNQTKKQEESNWLNNIIYIGAGLAIIIVLVLLITNHKKNKLD